MLQEGCELTMAPGHGLAWYATGLEIINPRYPAGTSATNPIIVERRRFSVRVPHWRWFLLATVALAVATISLSIWLPYR